LQAEATLAKSEATLNNARLDLNRYQQLFESAAIAEQTVATQQAQVNAARSVLDELGIDVPLIGLAKRLEEVWVPGEEFPVILPRTSPALYLLQHLRDESHRFAITHHRKKRSAGMTRSVLDGIPGLGPARQAALLREFGSVTRIRQADVDDITRVKGIGPALAATILAHLNSPGTEQ